MKSNILELLILEINLVCRKAILEMKKIYLKINYEVNENLVLKIFQIHHKIKEVNFN